MPLDIVRERLYGDDEILEAMQTALHLYDQLEVPTGLEALTFQMVVQMTCATTVSQRPSGVVVADGLLGPGL